MTSLFCKKLETILIKSNKKKTQIYDCFLQSTPKEKTFSGFKENLESHLNFDHKMVRMPMEIEYTLVYKRTLQSQSSTINNNKPSDNKFKKTMKRSKKKYIVSLRIEGENLKIAHRLPKSFHNVMKEISCQNGITKQWVASRINSL